MGLLNELRKRIVGLEADVKRLDPNPEGMMIGGGFDELAVQCRLLRERAECAEAERDKLKEQALHHNTICEGLENHAKRVGEKADRLREALLTIIGPTLKLEASEGIFRTAKAALVDCEGE